MRLRIPWLIDIETVSDTQQVSELAGHPSLDRDLERAGPLFNRIILNRVLNVFEADERPLPGFRGRDDTDRATMQAELKGRLDTLARQNEFDREVLQPAINFVANRPGCDLDEAMAATCKLLADLFDKNTAKDGADLWDHARTIQTSLRTLSVTGAVNRLLGRNIVARNEILKAVGEKPNGLHAIAVTTANLSVTLEKMRSLQVADSSANGVNPDTVEGFWMLVRVAPETLLRRVKATMSLPTSGNILTRSSLIILRTRKAQRSEPLLGYAFQEGKWSACPASKYVVALCWFIWCRAQEQAGEGNSK